MFKSDRKILEEQIDTLNIKQQYIQKHILRTELHIQHIEEQINQEQLKRESNSKLLSYLNKTLSNIINNVIMYYDTYKKFEDVKQNYYKQITDLQFKYNHMIQIDIPKVGKDNMGNKELVDLLIKNSSSNNDIPNLLLEEEYKI